jgi:heme/copper-type cytochrome/quinol oxidase subunit 2
LGATADVLSVYGLVIASFMAGSQWGNHLSLADDNKWAIRLPLVSNVIAIVLWLGFLMLPVVGFIWLLVIGFASMLMIDYGLNRARIITPDYFKVRIYVTAIVVVSLIVAAMQ